MSLGGALSELQRGLVPLFDQDQIRKLEPNEPPVRAAAEAAGTWAKAVASWAVTAGFVLLPAKEAVFRAALTPAFLPVPPQGPVIIGQAFSVFWAGNTFPAFLPGPNTALFLPTPFLPISPPPPPEATATQLAQNLAQTVYVYSLTNGSLVPPGPGGPVPFPP